MNEFITSLLNLLRLLKNYLSDDLLTGKLRKCLAAVPPDIILLIVCLIILVFVVIGSCKLFSSRPSR